MSIRGLVGVPVAATPVVDAVGSATPTIVSVDRWGLPGVTIISNSTSSLPDGANIVYYNPFYATRAVTVWELACEVTTLAASSQTLIGIYRADRNWSPTTLVVTSSLLDSSTNGTKSEAMTVRLDPGRYLTAIWNSVNCTYRVFNGGVPGYPVTNLGTANATLIATRSGTQSGLSALPATAPAITTVLGASTGPQRHFVLMRARESA